IAFVPEGQADSSQARSAWVAMQRAPSRRDGRSRCRSQRYLSSNRSPGMSQRQRGLLSCCPSGTQYSLPAEVLIKLALMGLKPWVKLFSPFGFGATNRAKIALTCYLSSTSTLELIAPASELKARSLRVAWRQQRRIPLRFL